MIRKLRIFYDNITSSIAFLPAIISLIFLCLSLLIVYLELTTLRTPVIESLQVLMVKGNDNARHVLGALIGGTISLTVFSFSMMMILLNQASSSFSPRILPGLLTDKKHQFVLGFCIGTIIYCIIIILNIKPGETDQNSPKFGVLLAMLLGVICLALFIYFIHLISQKLQVDTIISTLARQATELIQKESAGKSLANKPDPAKANVWFLLNSDTAGYLNDIHKPRLERLVRNHQLQVKLLYPVGAFLLKDTAFAEVSCKPEQNTDTLHKNMVTCFHFSYEPFGKGTYLHFINQISEIAVKALSPGINDPGTALIALDHLSAIVCCLYRQKQIHASSLSKTLPMILYKDYSLHELLTQFIDPISYYGKSSAKVQAKILAFYARLLPFVQPSHKEIIYRQLEELRLSIERNIEFSAQAAALAEEIKKLKLASRQDS